MPAGDTVLPGGVLFTAAGSQTLTLQDLFADFRAGGGMAVIGASSALQFAWESSQLGHGVFTYALLQGFSTRAIDLNQDGCVRASELYRYLADQVLRATGGYQRPSSRGIQPEADFVVAQFESTRPDPTELLQRYLQASSSWSDDFEAVEAMVDDTVDFFGTRLSRAEVMADEYQYSQRWSHREYALLNVQHEQAADRMTATLRYQMKFEAADGNGHEQSGTQNLEMVLAWRNGGWRITSIRVLGKEPVTSKAPR